MEEVQEDNELEELVAEPPAVEAVCPEAAAPVTEAPDPSTPKEPSADSERSKFSFKLIFSGSFNFFLFESSQLIYLKKKCVGYGRRGCVRFAWTRKCRLRTSRAATSSRVSSALPLWKIVRCVATRSKEPFAFSSRKLRRRLLLCPPPMESFVQIYRYSGRKQNPGTFLPAGVSQSFICWETWDLILFFMIFFLQRNES